MATATQDATDSGQSNATDTSVDEDSQDTEDQDLDDERSLIDDDEALDLGEDEDEETDEGLDDSDEAAATDSDEDEDQESDEDVGSEDEEAVAADTTAADDEAERKRQNSEAAARRIEERDVQKAQAKLQSQVTYVQAGANDAYQEAIDAGLTPNEAQVAANREATSRQTQVDTYNNRIELATGRVQTGIDKAVASIDLFRTGTPKVKEELASALDDFEAMHVQRDANGDIVQVTGDVFQFLQKKAGSIKAIMAEGSQAQVSAKKKQKSRTFTKPTRTPKKPKGDPDLDGFDEEASKY